MSLIKVSGDKKAIEVSIPLTSISGKVRVKIRHAFSDYGISTATRTIPFGLKHYVEGKSVMMSPLKIKKNLNSLL
ncbi:hypothetical protein VN0871_09880 [Helicobacter pylori]